MCGTLVEKTAIEFALALRSYIYHEGVDTATTTNHTRMQPRET